MMSLHAIVHRLYREVAGFRLLSAALGLSALLVGPYCLAQESFHQPERGQQLFVDDVADNSFKVFDSDTGTFIGRFGDAASAGLVGPAGMIFTDGQLVVVNQNTGLPKAGEILRFDGRTGTFVGKLVSSSDRHAPFAPRGIVRGGPGRDYYVGDLGLQNGCVSQGNVKVYDDAGAFRGDMNRRRFTPEFHPRGVVFGPDGLLYVTAVGCLDATDPLFDPLTSPLIGFVLRFNPYSNQFIDVFASNASIADLHRPEGLVFDRAGNLWVTSFRASASDSDKILKLDGRTGRLLDELVLSTPPAPRAFAQAIIFGPDGNLFIPIAGGDPTTAGQVRRCNPKTKVCDVVGAAGGALQAPQYAIFRNTNPATLGYGE